MKIIGIDPGIASTGYGLIKVNNQKIELVDHGLIRTKAHQLIEKRLKLIQESLGEILEKHKPQEGALEKIFFFRNKKSVISVSQAIGAIGLCVYDYKIPFSRYAPLEVKKGLIDYGRASKKEVQEFVKKELKLKKMPTPRHAADALAIAIYHSRKIKET